jgi:branched-chain amino acid transport system ATP-binding protein
VSGQGQNVTDAVAKLLIDLADEGLVIVLVMTDLALVVSICTKVVALDSGRLLAVGTPDEVRTNLRLQEPYLRRELSR